ncbi:copper resistance protein CopC [Micromonospora sp. WMMA1363]|uniref:copper resistance CopC family protein n=1 Tax=Micromonospora sp. WMMA1363 TaxID=3053985 RepID=UPI00259CB7D6|nr:copper resistance CopC family protein [Micromonospora sp. WMMA1363]MDM4719264.1 copper resistance protein CopC [Micromonospora sp. WMMA1363]
MARAAYALAVLSVAALVVLAGPRAAHADERLTTSDPAADATLATTPAAVELTFTGEPELTDSHVVVLDARAAEVSTGEPRRADRWTLRQPVTPGVTGDLTVAWHVSFHDGGESRGTLRFSVGTGRPPAPAGPALDRAATDLLDSHLHTVDPLSAVLLLVNGVVVLGAATLLAVRDPRRPRPWRLPADFGGPGPPTILPRTGDPNPARADDQTTGRGTT